MFTMRVVIWKQHENTLMKKNRARTRRKWKKKKDYYECLTVIIHAVLSAWHYKNTKCLGVSAVTDQFLMTWYFLPPVILWIPISKVAEVEKASDASTQQTPPLFSEAGGRVQLLNGVSKRFDSLVTKSRLLDLFLKAGNGAAKESFCRGRAKESWGGFHLQSSFLQWATSKLSSATRNRCDIYLPWDEISDK